MIDLTKRDGLNYHSYVMGSLGNLRVSCRNNSVTFYIFGLNFENKAGSFGKSTHKQIYFSIKKRKLELFCFEKRIVHTEL